MPFGGLTPRAAIDAPVLQEGVDAGSQVGGEIVAVDLNFRICADAETGVAGGCSYGVAVVGARMNDLSGRIPGSVLEDEAFHDVGPSGDSAAGEPSGQDFRHGGHVWNDPEAALRAAW